MLLHRLAQMKRCKMITDVVGNICAHLFLLICDHLWNMQLLFCRQGGNMNPKNKQKRKLRLMVKTAVLFFCITFCSGQYASAGDLRSYLGGLKNSAESKVKWTVGSIVGKYAGPTAGNIVKTGDWTRALITTRGAMTAGRIIGSAAIGMGAAATYVVPSVGSAITIGKAIYGTNLRETASSSLRGGYNYVKPIFANYVKPTLRSALFFLPQSVAGAEWKPVNQSSANGTNYTAVPTDALFKPEGLFGLPQNANNTKGNLTTPTQNNTRPLAPLAPPNLSTEGTKEAFPFFIPTGNPAVDAFKRLGVDARPVQVPSAASIPITEEVLTQRNQFSSKELIGYYRNDGRRESDISIYNPKYDIRIDSNPSVIANQINPASLDKEKGVLYYNDGTQYGYRSIRNPAYDIQKNPNNSLSAESIDPNQINQKSLTSLTGPYYNDGTRYRDRSIKNSTYDILINFKKKENDI